MDTIFKFLRRIMFTLTLQISKLTKAVVLNSFPHERFWQFVYKENIRCTRLMQRSLQVVIRQKFVLWSLKIEAQLPTKVRLIWLSSFREEDCQKSANQKQELSGDHVCQRIGIKCAIFIEDLPQQLPTKFRFIWLSSLRGEDFIKSANQKEELSVQTMFVNGSG